MTVFWMSLLGNGLDESRSPVTMANVELWKHLGCGKRIGSSLTITGEWDPLREWEPCLEIFHTF